MEYKEKLAIVTTVKDEEDNIALFYQAVSKALNDTVSFDIWYIDDGSTDLSLDKIKSLAKEKENVHYVSFSRNFGKESAIFAGLVATKVYDLVAIMDTDLQDPPTLIPKMIEKLTADKLDVVGSFRKDRKGENIIISFFSNSFYKVLSKISSTKTLSGLRDFRVMKREVADAVLSMPETQRFSKGIFNWVGFKTDYLGYSNIKRENGQTKWGFWKLLKYAISGMIAFSTFPLTLVTVLGIATTVLAFILGVFLIVRKLLNPAIAIGGWTTMLTLIMFFGGLQMFSLGIVGRYIASIFLETKHRPLYIVKESK